MTGPADAIEVPSLCPYCGVGCQVTYHVAGNRIAMVTGRQGPSNLGRLCVKGRFGFDYVHNRQRLTTPLIRKPGVRKDPVNLVDPAQPESTFREATWEEALELAAEGLRRVRDDVGPAALAGFGSAKGSNEEAYLFQKLVRTAFGTNNVDHCTRLCHASSVAALFEGLGSAAVSNPVADVQFADCIIIIGANPTVNHPVAATFMKNAIERGTKLILADPRRTELARFATHMLQFRPGTDVAFLSSMLHVIVEEGLTDREFIARRSKIHILVDQRGAPLAIQVSGANQHDKWSVAHLVFHIVVKRPTTEQHFCADKGYDYDDVFEVVLGQGYVPHIKHRRRKNEPPDPYPVPGELSHPARRWVVERTLSWLAKRRSLRTRWCKKSSNWLAFVQLACASILCDMAVFG